MTDEQNIPEGYYSMEEMRQILGLSKSTFATARSQAKHGTNPRIPPEIKIGHLVLYDKESFKEWLKSKETDRTSKYKKY